MNGRLIFCVAILLPVAVLGHAQLESPSAFNPSPSKTAKCGGVNAGPVNTLPAGALQTLSWKIIAGDGTGALSMMVDPTGTTGNFPSVHNGALPAGSQAQVVTLTELDGTPSAVGSSYRHTFTWPAGLTCTGTIGGATNVCTAQVFSTSDWVACFAFVTTAPVQAGGSSTGSAAVLGACEIATFQAGSNPLCSTVAGQNVFVPIGFTVDLLDTLARSTLETNLVNPRVFSNAQEVPPTGLITSCYTCYVKYLCGDTFRLCNKNGVITGPAAGACLSSCREFTCYCGLTEFHKSLYNCGKYSNAQFDSVTNCTIPIKNQCVAPVVTSTGAQCSDLFCAAPRSAVLQPLLLAAAALVTVALLYANL